MKSDLVLSMFEIVGSPVCVSSDDGQKVYDRLAVAVKEGRRISLSFRNIIALTPAFLMPRLASCMPRSAKSK
ncbi:MAG: STAS-like domain-containing protein [Sulfurimicrobium sp.]|nr:STAS-like domain-containing protein [Sulfurimicrobium sp.]